jgi:hypothetical protein
MSVQLGQGLIESMLLLATLLVVLCSVHRTAGLRQLTLTALYESALTVFGGKGHSSFADSITENTETQNSIENELLGRHSGLLTRGADIQHLPTQVIGRLRQFSDNVSRIRRFSYLYTGAGRANSYQDVHTNIGGSKRVWRSASLLSERVARQAALRSRPNDSVWRRPAPQFDWLSAWADLVPRSSTRTRK